MQIQNDLPQAATRIENVIHDQNLVVCGGVFQQVLKAMNESYLATQETMSNIQSVASEARALNDMASGLKRTVTD